MRKTDKNPSLRSFKFNGENWYYSNIEMNGDVLCLWQGYREIYLLFWEYIRKQFDLIRKLGGFLQRSHPLRRSEEELRVMWSKNGRKALQEGETARGKTLCWEEAWQHDRLKQGHCGDSEAVWYKIRMET